MDMSKTFVSRSEGSSRVTFALRIENRATGERIVRIAIYLYSSMGGVCLRMRSARMSRLGADRRRCRVSHEAQRRRRLQRHRAHLVRYVRAGRTLGR